MNVVAVNPATGNVGVTIIGSDRSLAEDTSEDETDNTGDSVACVDVHSIVEAEEALERGEQVGNGSGYDTDEDSSGNSDEASSGSLQGHSSRPSVHWVPQRLPVLTIATRPTMAPVQKPTADHLRSRR